MDGDEWLEMYEGASRMAPWKSTLVAKSDELSFIPGAHMVEGRQEKSSSGNSTPTGCPVPNVQSWKYANNIIQTRQVIFRNIYVYSYALHVLMKKGHGFEEEQGGLCGSVEGEKEEM